jgi:hypothetical protein
MKSYLITGCCIVLIRKGLECMGMPIMPPGFASELYVKCETQVID